MTHGHYLMTVIQTDTGLTAFTTITSSQPMIRSREENTRQLRVALSAVCKNKPLRDKLPVK